MSEQATGGEVVFEYEVVRKHATIVAYKLHQEYMAEDAVQHACMLVLKRLASFDPARGSFGAFVRVICATDLKQWLLECIAAVKIPTQQRKEASERFALERRIALYGGRLDVYDMYSAMDKVDGQDGAETPASTAMHNIKHNAKFPSTRAALVSESHTNMGEQTLDVQRIRAYVQRALVAALPAEETAMAMQVYMGMEAPGSLSPASRKRFRQVLAQAQATLTELVA